MLKYIYIALFGLLFFSGCAPKFLVKNVYIPPVGKKAKSCLNNCSYKKQQCQSRCDSEYNVCLNEALKRAKDIKAISDLEYKKRYSIYIEKLNTYNTKIHDWQIVYDATYRDWIYFRNRCKKSNDRYACDRVRDLRFVLDKMINHKPIAPKPPVRASLNQILQKEQAVCKNDCGCQREYDVCFLNCGGEIQMRKICIANCDKK